MGLTASELAIIVTAKDQASATLKSVGSNAKNAGGAFTGLGKAAKIAGVAMAAMAAAGTAILAKGLWDCVKAASEAEDISAQLGAVLKSTGGAAGLSAKEINAMALALSEVTRFEDDAIVAGQNLLLTFTNIGKDIFPQATETMLDMSTALGQDLKSSAIQMGKALNDPILGVTALQRVGVLFTEAQKKTIETMVESGDLMGAQKLILAELNREFGGAAKAAGETFAGKLDILHNALGNIKEAVGEPLLKPLTAVISKMVEFATRPDIIEAARNFGSAMANIAEKGTGPLIAGLQGIVTFGGNAMKTISDIVDVLSGTYTGTPEIKINAAGLAEWTYPASFAKRLSDAIRDDDWSVVTAAAQEFIGGAVMEGIGAAMTVNNIIQVKLQEWMTADETHQAAYDLGYNLTDDIIEGLTTGVGEKFDLTKLLTAPLAGAKQKAAMVDDFVAALDELITGALDRVFGKGSELGRIIGAGVKNALRVATQMLTMDFRGFAGDVWHGVADPINEMDWASIGTGISNAILSGLEGIKNGVATILNTVIDAVNSLIDQLNKVPGVSIGKLGHLEIAKGYDFDARGHQGMAKGGAFVVPPGFPNDSYPMLVQSGETVMVWPQGKNVRGFAGGSSPLNYTPKWATPPEATSTGTLGALGAGVGAKVGSWGTAPTPTVLQSTSPYYTDHRALSALQTYVAAWPPALMHAMQQPFRSVGIQWVDDILVGMGTMTEIPSSVTATLTDVFRRWWGGLDAEDKLGGDMRRKIQSWIGDWTDVATTQTGESVGQIAARMLDTLIKTGGSAVAGIVSQNRELFMSIMGNAANTLIGGAFAGIDMLTGMAGVFGGLGGAAASRYEETVIAPMREELAILEEQGTQVEKIAELKKQIADAEEKALSFQKQQQDLQWLQAQLDLVKLIKDNGLSANILSGLQLGRYADPAAIMDAMGRAIEAMTTGIQAQLGGMGVSLAAAGGEGKATIEVSPQYVVYQSYESIKDDIWMMQKLAA